MTAPSIRPTRPSQTDIIRDELLRCQGDWVPMPRLHQLSGAYAVHSRAADIRRIYRDDVQNKRITCPHSGKVESYYRIPSPDQTELGI